jgi:DnaK suppressor protein
MTLSQSRVDVAPVTERHQTHSAQARLQAEHALQVELLARPRPSHEQQATTGQGETDHVNIDMERQLAALLDAHAEQAIEEIAAALARIEDGTYGTCARCATRIDAERLSALPRVKFCIDCQRVCERP